VFPSISNCKTAKDYPDNEAFTPITPQIHKGNKQIGNPKKTQVTPSIPLASSLN